MLGWQGVRSLCKDGGRGGDREETHQAPQRKQLGLGLGRFSEEGDMEECGVCNAQSGSRGRIHSGKGTPVTGTGDETRNGYYFTSQLAFSHFLETISLETIQFLTLFFFYYI